MGVAYFIRRFFWSLFVIFAVALVAFVLVRVLPGDPIAAWVGDHPTQEQIDRARSELGYDQPVYIQAVKYFSRLMRGDLGVSLRTRRPVWDEIRRRFAATFELTTFAMLITLLLGAPIGLAAANHPGHWLSRTEKALSLTGVAIPIFWLGMLLQMYFSGSLNWLPLQGQRALPKPDKIYSGLLLLDTLFNGEFDKFADALQHILMPALTLVAATFGIITRTVRNAAAQTLNQDYIRTAHAYGIRRRTVLYVYVLKNILIPLITVSGLVYGYLLGGTFLVERVFDWPGLGQLAVLSILTDDLPAVTGVALVYAVVYTFINYVLDVIYAGVDPRLRKSA